MSIILMTGGNPISEVSTNETASIREPDNCFDITFGENCEINAENLSVLIKFNNK